MLRSCENIQGSGFADEEFRVRPALSCARLPIAGGAGARQPKARVKFAWAVREDQRTISLAIDVRGFDVTLVVFAELACAAPNAVSALLPPW